ncbi:MAG: hypothetical protein HY396_00855 [Candidatus Doudnabacteria bacterium]|nr:hypothetical protein [Candidatus Doudnabacteria bacterium]
MFVTLRLQSITDKIKEYKKRASYIVKKKEKHFNKTPGIAKPYERSASGIFKELEEIEDNYRTKYDRNSEMKSDIAALARTFEPNLNLDNISFLNDTADNLSIYISQRREMISSVKLPGIVTAGSIIYTILLLSVTDLLSKINCLALLLFILAICWSVLSIVLIAKSSWQLLKATGEKI